MAKIKPKLIQNVFEARYERGYRYLDRCGDVMVILEEALPSKSNNSVWMPDDARPTGARMKCPDFNLTVVFDTTRLVVDQNPVDKKCSFDDISQYIFGTIYSKFNINTIIRFGNRKYYIYPADSVDDAKKHSVKKAPMKSWPVNELDDMKLRQCQATTIFEKPDSSIGVSFSIKPVSRVESPIKIDERLRIAPHLLPKGQREALIEQLRRQQQREKEPVAGLMVDVDYYWVKPEETSVKVFLEKAQNEIKRLVDSFEDT